MRIVHFEIPADDPGRAIAFYGKAFGWTFDKWDGPMEYWMIKTGDGPGIDGGVDEADVAGPAADQRGRGPVASTTPLAPSWRLAAP